MGGAPRGSQLIYQGTIRIDWP
eukprot:SAG11_NODE_6126_length_1383_cov_1.598131_1_plen_21_part_10